MSDRPRYVVRYSGISRWIEQRAKALEHWSESQVQEIIDREKKQAGVFVKVGGGTTPHLNEANVIGWASAKKWTAIEYELVPVRIVII